MNVIFMEDNKSNVCYPHQEFPFCVPTSLLTLYVSYLLQNKICVPQDQKISVSSFKDKFPLAAGHYTGTLKFDCNSGKSCFTFDVEFKRGK